MKSARNASMGGAKQSIPGLSQGTTQQLTERQRDDRAQALMLEYSFEFKEFVKKLIDKLSSKIPFEKIDVAYLKLDDKRPAANASGDSNAEEDVPRGMMDDMDYQYCYRSLLIESKEWLNTLKSLDSYLAGKQEPQLVKSKPAKEPKKAKGAEKRGPPAKPEEEVKQRCMNLKATMDKKTKLQKCSVLNFADEENMGDFMQFLIKHMTFTEKMIHSTIYFGDMVEQAIRFSNLEQFEKNAQMDQEGKENLGEEAFASAFQEQARADRMEEQYKKSRNLNYKFMSVDQLTVFRKQFFKSVNQIILRMYKSTFALYSMYPAFNQFESVSIFDKVYQLQLIMHSHSAYHTINKRFYHKMELPVLFDFEIEAQILLKDGGIKNKSVKVIQEASKIIREKIDNELEHVFQSHQLLPDFFIGSPVMQRIWMDVIVKDFGHDSKFQTKVGLDVVKMAFQKYFGGHVDGVLSEESFSLFQNFLEIYEEPLTNYQYVHLIDLVNFSDFIDLTNVLHFFQSDRIAECLEQLKQEKSIVQEFYNHNFTNQKAQSRGNFVVESNGQYDMGFATQVHDLLNVQRQMDTRRLDYMGEKQLPENYDQGQTLFVRTARCIEKGDFDFLYFLNLFGVRQILNEELSYAHYMNERLDSEFTIASDRNDKEKMAAYDEQIEKIITATKDPGEIEKEQPPPEVSSPKEMVSRDFETGGALSEREGRVQQSFTSDSLPAGKELKGVRNSSTIDMQKVKQNQLEFEEKENQTIGGQPRAFSPVSSDEEGKKGVKSSQDTKKTSKKVRIDSKASDSDDERKKKQILKKRKTQRLTNANASAGQLSTASQLGMQQMEFEDCDLLGLNTLLEVNEVFERFQELVADNSDVDDNDFQTTTQQEGYLGGSDPIVVSGRQSAASVEQLAVDKMPLPEAIRMYQSKNNIHDIISGNQKGTKQRLKKRFKNEIGKTFGSYEALKASDEFRGYFPSDRGYLLLFEAEEEVRFLSQNGIFQKILQQQNFLNQQPEEPIGTTLRMDPSYPDKEPQADMFDQYGFEKREGTKAYLPLFIPFERLMEKRSNKENKYLPQRVLEYYIFKDFNTFLQKKRVQEILANRRDYTQPLIGQPDLNMLKRYVFSEFKLHMFQIEEAHLKVLQANIRKVICKRFFNIFTKLSSISIDGFKRERYVIKIQHLSNEIIRAQQDLLQEEKTVESGALSVHDKNMLNQSIQRITDLMLKIETLTADKQQMEQTLKEKEQKWIQNDTIYKQRRIILNYIIRLNLEVSNEEWVLTRLESEKVQSRNLSGRSNELIVFIIQHIFSQNRLLSVNFIAEINQFINSQREEMGQLKRTQHELTSKVQAIEEEKREMRKKIEEMRQICDLKEAKDQLQLDISAQEIRVAQLKKQLGKGKAISHDAAAPI